MFRDNRVLKEMRHGRERQRRGGRRLAGPTPSPTRRGSELQARLAEQLTRMADVRDHLILELPAGDEGGTAPYAQFAGFGGGTLRAELSGDAYLAPVHRLDADCRGCSLMGGRATTRRAQLAPRAPARGREPREPHGGLGVPRRVRGRPPAAADLQRLGPGLRRGGRNGAGVDQAPAELPARDDAEPFVLAPSDRDELVEMVLMTLHATLGERPPVDDDGDVVLTHLDQPVWIRVLHDQPASRSSPASPTASARAARPRSSSRSSTATTRGSSGSSATAPCGSTW